MIAQTNSPKLPTIDLYSEHSDHPLFVVCDSPPTTCNYRCPYCFWHFDRGFMPFAKEFEQWKQVMSRLLGKTTWPLMLCIGPSGEALMLPEWWDYLREILKHPHVKMASFLSNLSKPIAPFLEGLDTSRIGMTGTLHPTQFRDKEAGFRDFAAQVLYLRDIGVKVCVNYVLTPYQIKDYPRYKKYFADQGITMVANIFRGQYKGKSYPESFSAEDLVAIKEHLSDIPHIYEFQSMTKDPFGNPCTAARYAINVRDDGSVYPCYFDSERLGSVFDEELHLYRENRPCGAHQCVCKWSIPLQEYIVKDYRGVGNIHEVLPRPAGEPGDHPFA